MLSGVGAKPVSQQAVNSNLEGSTTGSVAGGLVQGQKVDKATDPEFGAIWKDIQSKFGAKPDKPREIKKTLGKDDFLRIMITQMKNQDPLSPFKADEMAQQMATYASVEQLQNINSGIGKLGNANQPLERLAMTNMIGKVVTIDRERFQHEEGKNQTLQFDIPRDAKNVRLVVANMQNDVIVDKDLGPMPKGAGSFVWDGLAANRLPSKPGQYQFKIQAVDDSDRTIPTDPKVRTPIMGVSFEGSEPVFLVGDAKNPQKITMQNISKIESTIESGVIPGARPLVANHEPDEASQQKTTVLPARKPFAQMGVPAAMEQERKMESMKQEAAKEDVWSAQKPRGSVIEGPGDSEEKGFPSGFSPEPKPAQNSPLGKSDTLNNASQGNNVNLAKGGEE